MTDLAHTAMRTLSRARSLRSHEAGLSDSQWAEAAAITDRVDDLAERLLDTLPRPDYDTVDGARRISHTRLAAGHEHITAAADSIDNAVAASLRVGDPDGDAIELAAIADKIRSLAGTLTDEGTRNKDAIAHALGLPGRPRPRS